MSNNWKPKIGLRTLKTSLAVGISMLTVDLLNLHSPLFAGIGAISSMQSSVSESLKSGKNRMLGTIVGAVVGIIFSALLPHNYISLSIGIILTIYINNYFGWKKALQLACYVYISIFLNDVEDRIPYTTNRLLSTFVGIVVATLINYFIAAPDIKKEFIEQKNDIYEKYKSLVFNLVNTNIEILYADITSDLNRLEESFDLYKQEINYNFSKSRISKGSNSIIRMVEEISTDIHTMIILDMKPLLNEENILLFENLYSIEYTPIERERSELDIVYNYHLNRTLNNLFKIEGLLKD
ncbi:MAG: aromatic acid exporter family protein [Tissierellia bacterium]|nr:aromatic acid exporter family protein [Tissierellia bacterium]